MNIFNFRINHVKKNSCFLFNKIPKMNYNIKDRFLETTNNILYNKEKETNKTCRINTFGNIANNKNRNEKTKINSFTRPYIKQLSQYCFLTLKNKNDIPKLNECKKKDHFISPERDDKTNIYFNLIKTYYDENGKKLKPKQTVVYPIDNEADYPKIIKSKKKKKNNSSDENGNENFLNFEKKNKTLNDNCNIYFEQLEKENKKKYNNKKDNLKLTNNNKIKNKIQLDISCGDFIYRNKYQNPLNSPSLSEKSFNIFFQNKSGDYIINDVKRNPIITDSVGNLNNENKLLSETNDNYLIINSNNNYNKVHSNEKEKDENNDNEIMAYFNKKIFRHRRAPTTRINGMKLTQEIKSYDSFNNKAYQYYRNKNAPIFQKKKISDSFDDVKKINKIIENNNNSLISNYIDRLNNTKNNSRKIVFNSGGNYRHKNSTLSWTKINIYRNKNNNNNKIISKTKISPKRLEKYFNPNQFNKNTMSLKTQIRKTPPGIEIIDINNITFKKPFKIIKKNDYNNLVSEINKTNPNDNIINNNKSEIYSYYNNKISLINNIKKAKMLGQNISYNYDTQKEPSNLNNKNKNNSINVKNDSDIIHSNNIKYMKQKFRQNPYNFSNEKKKILDSINSFNGRRKSKNQYNENINNINQNAITINSYNNRNYNINMDKITQKEKIKKYLQKNSLHNEMNNIIITNNNAIKENYKGNNYLEGLISPGNKLNNISYQISITEPSIIYNQIKINNSIKPATDNKNNAPKIIIEKDKNNKKMYILRKKLKDGVIKLKTKFEVKNKLGIRNEIKNNKNNS